MRKINYGLQKSFTGEESDETIYKTQHLLETADKHGLILFETPSVIPSYSKFIAISNEIELEISLNNDRDIKSLHMIKKLNPPKVDQVYSPTQTYKRTCSTAEKLNRENHAIQCDKCGKMTFFINGLTQFCSHCGEKISDENVKFCPRCKDDSVYSPDYVFCLKCGEKLIEHPEISPLDFETEELLYGVYLESEFMNYEKIIPQH